MIILVPLFCFAVFCLVWPTFSADPKPTIRPLSMDEQAAWGIYRVQDASKVARMKSTRAQDTMAWDARVAWLKRGIRPRATGPSVEPEQNRRIQQ